jgi:peptidyl-dipeptidase Dcp
MNVLLGPWDTPFGLPPFARVRDEDFGPAFDEALVRARANILAIADGPDADFAGVIEALELAEGDLDRVAGVFYNLAGADSTDAREALMRELAPKMSAFSSEVTNNAALWAKIEALWQGRDGLGLTAEQARVLELYRQMFVRSGAALEGAAAERLTAVKARLAVLGTEFSQNLLADERAWFMELSATDLAALPGFVQDAALAAGVEKGVGPVVTLSRSLIVPFRSFLPIGPCGKRPMPPGWRAGRMAGRPTTGESRRRSWRCGMSGRSFWAMPISSASSWNRRWPRPARRCAIC